MSLTESIYATLLSHMQRFLTLSQQQRTIFLRDCYTFMGSNFMKALTSIEYLPRKISITEYSMFYIMIIEKQKVVLFKDRMTLRDPDINKVFKFDIECNCEDSWKRKIDKNAPLLCTHQILLYLVQAMKPADIKIQRGYEDNRDPLGQILLLIK